MRLACLWIILGAVFAFGCKEKCDCESQTPTGTTIATVSVAPAPTPAPTPDAQPTTTPTPATLEFTSCRARPSAIRMGTTFSIDYSVTRGLVRLAKLDEQAFAMALPSTGSYVLREGEPGYPLDTGVQKYRCISAENRTITEKTSVEVLP